MLLRSHPNELVKMVEKAISVTEQNITKNIKKVIAGQQCLTDGREMDFFLRSENR
jgi:hypothetical protein